MGRDTRGNLLWAKSQQPTDAPFCLLAYLSVCFPCLAPNSLCKPCLTLNRAEAGIHQPSLGAEGPDSIVICQF